MDQTSPISDAFLRAPSPSPAASSGRPQLGLVEAGFRLVHPAAEIPPEWSAALSALLGWVGIAAEIVPAAQGGRLKRLADWAAPGAAPLFAPWLGLSPAAFQHGGLAHLPQAQFVVSYLVDHPRGAAPGLGGLDLMLMSPHPSQCLAEDAGDVPVPRAGMPARSPTAPLSRCCAAARRSASGRSRCGAPCRMTKTKAPGAIPPICALSHLMKTSQRAKGALSCQVVRLSPVNWPMCCGRFRTPIASACS